MFDCHSTFLNGKLDADEDVYRLHLHGATTTPCHCQSRSLCCQIAQVHLWPQTGADISLQKSEADPAILYVYIGSEVIILAIHVDDCTITGSSEALQKDYKAHVGEKFKPTDLGLVLWLLSFAITHNQVAHTITLSQCWSALRTEGHPWSRLHGGITLL